MQRLEQNHYATLGLDRQCTEEQIRAAYRLLAKQLHPDVNRGSHESVARTQALNLAYEILGDPDRRRLYDYELSCAQKVPRAHASKFERNISEDLHVRIDDLFKGTIREVRVNDPGNPDGPEIYELIVPAETAVGARFKISRQRGGFVLIRIRALPHFQFKVRGSDLRRDLKITSRRASQGGEEIVAGPTGSRLRVKIKAGVARGEIIRITGEGLPKPRGGRGDLLLRIVYQPEVRIVRRK